MKAQNIVNTNGNTAPNQFIITDENLVTFQSYESTIAVYDREMQVLFVFPDWDYSKTTLKYLKQFVNEETHFNYTSQKQFEKEMLNNPNIFKAEEYHKRQK